MFTIDFKKESLRGFGFVSFRKEIERQLDLVSGKTFQAQEIIRKILYVSTSQNIDSGGRPGWAPRKYKYAWPPLRKTGTGRNSVLNAIQETAWYVRGKEQVFHIWVIFYYEFHQNANQYRVRFAEREYIKLQPHEQQVIEKKIFEALRNI